MGIVDTTERTTSKGVEMLIVTSRATYTNQRGEKLVTNAETLIWTALPPAIPRPRRIVTGGQMTIGAVVPALTRTIEQADMIAYAGATWDWHRMHYDREYLDAKHLDRPRWSTARCSARSSRSRSRTGWARGRITKLHFRFKNLVFAGETVKVMRLGHGDRAAGRRHRALTIESRVEVQGEASGSRSRPPAPR